MSLTPAQVRESVAEMVHVLGATATDYGTQVTFAECPVPDEECPGCQYEADEVLALMKLAVAADEDRLCPTCNGRRWQDAPVPGSDPPLFELCPGCGGSGVAHDLR